MPILCAIVSEGDLVAVARLAVIAAVGRLWVEQFKHIDVNLRNVALAPLAVIIRAGLYLPLDVELGALMHIPCNHIGCLSPRNEVVPLCALWYLRTVLRV